MIGETPDRVKTTHPALQFPSTMAPGGQPVEDQYFITVRGVAGPAVRAIYADLQVITTDETTVLSGVLPAQAALHGVPHRIEDLGLEVLAVRRQP